MVPGRGFANTWEALASYLPGKCELSRQTTGGGHPLTQRLELIE
jgi:hypothetical protein